MGSLREYWRKNKQRNRELDKELGKLYYNAWEPMPGESFTEFKRRFKKSKRFPF